MSNITPQWIHYNRFKSEERRELLRHFVRCEGAHEVGTDLLPRGISPDGETATLGHRRANTQRAYENDQRRYVAWIASAGGDPLNPTDELWDHYFRELASQRLPNGKPRRYRTLVRASASISNLFRQHNLPSPTWSFAHKRLLRELSRFDERDTRSAKPLYGPEVRQLLESYDLSDYRSVRDYTIAALGATRGFRSATIVGLLIENVAFEERGVVLRLRDEKTANNRDLKTTSQEHTDMHTHCLPCTLGHWVSLMKAWGYTDGPVFRGIDRWGNISDGPLNPRSITWLLRKGLRNAGDTNPNSYSSHSYRHGVVATGVLGGWTIEDIMLTTLHRSRAGLEPYMAKLDPWRLAPPQSPLSVLLRDSRSPGSGWAHATV